MKQPDIDRGRPAQDLGEASPVGDTEGEGFTASQFFHEAGAIIAVCLGLGLLARLVVAVLLGS
jgi:hypothetical protein